jgi:chromosome transmission fidelity protein 1
MEVNRKPEYESQFELDEYKSDNDNEKRSAARGTTDVDGLSASTLALLDRFKGHFSAENAQSQTDDNDIQIFYCSRTHSQLTQFVNELNRVKLSPSLPRQQSVLDNYVKVGNEDIGLDEGIKHLSLGSRKALCINSTVLSLGNATAINERCLDLQKPGIAAERKCPYLPSGENEAVLLDFRDHTLAAVRDIEDTAKIGKQLGICPYYASRSVIKYSEVSQLSLYIPPGFLLKCCRL